MLFTDADFISSVDLLSLDPEIKGIAAAEQIVLDGPAGLCAQAADEVGQKLLTETQAYTGFMPPFAMPYNQTAAVLNLVGPAVNRSRISLMQVCITPPNPTEASVSHPSTLKRYGIYTALEMVYRAAYYRKLTDRYEKRMADYRDQIRRKYWPRLFNQGVPIVLKPLAAPGAIHEFNAGTWDVNALSTPAGTNALASTQYDVTITWVDNTKYVTAQTKGNGG